MQLRKKVEILVLRATFQSDKTISKSMSEFDTAISHVAMAAKNRTKVTFHGKKLSGKQFLKVS